jgi:peptide chain release factor
MILLQLSAAQGPDECALAVAKALARLQQEAKALTVEVSVLETLQGKQKGTYRSLLFALKGEQAAQLASQWSGSMQWVHPSPYRSGHKRKNWFFGGEVFTPDSKQYDDDIRFQCCRASGAGGQHVNTTDSAVRAEHIQSGITVRVESERSQHANKRLAIMLINKKLAELADEQAAGATAARRMHHHQIERGNVKRTFKGDKFNPG